MSKTQLLAFSKLGGCPSGFIACVTILSGLKECSVPGMILASAAFASKKCDRDFSQACRYFEEQQKWQLFKIPSPHGSGFIYFRSLESIVIAWLGNPKFNGELTLLPLKTSHQNSIPNQYHFVRDISQRSWCSRDGKRVLFVSQVAFSTSKQALVSIVKFQLDADCLALGAHISNAPVKVIVLLNAFELTLDLKSLVRRSGPLTESIVDFDDLLTIDSLQPRCCSCVRIHAISCRPNFVDKELAEKQENFLKMDPEVIMNLAVFPDGFTLAGKIAAGANTLLVACMMV